MSVVPPHDPADKKAQQDRGVKEPARFVMTTVIPWWHGDSTFSELRGRIKTRLSSHYPEGYADRVAEAVRSGAAAQKIRSVDKVRVGGNALPRIERQILQAVRELKMEKRKRESRSTEKRDRLPSDGEEPTRESMRMVPRQAGGGSSLGSIALGGLLMGGAWLAWKRWGDQLPKELQ